MFRPSYVVGPGDAFVPSVLELDGGGRRRAPGRRLLSRAADRGRGRRGVRARRGRAARGRVPDRLRPRRARGDPLRAPARAARGSARAAWAVAARLRVREIAIEEADRLARGAGGYQGHAARRARLPALRRGVRRRARSRRCSVAGSRRSTRRSPPPFARRDAPAGLAVLRRAPTRGGRGGGGLRPARARRRSRARAPRRERCRGRGRGSGRGAAPRPRPRAARARAGRTRAVAEAIGRPAAQLRVGGGLREPPAPAGVRRPGRGATAATCRAAASCWRAIGGEAADLAESEDMLRDDGFPGEFLDHYMIETRFDVTGFPGAYWAAEDAEVDARSCSRPRSAGGARRAASRSAGRSRAIARSRRLGRAGRRSTRGRSAPPPPSWRRTDPRPGCCRSSRPLLRPQPLERVCALALAGATLPAALRTADGRIAWQVDTGPRSCSPRSARGRPDRAGTCCATSPRACPSRPAAAPPLGRGRARSRSDGLPDRRAACPAGRWPWPAASRASRPASPSPRHAGWPTRCCAGTDPTPDPLRADADAARAPSFERLLPFAVGSSAMRLGVTDYIDCAHLLAGHAKCGQLHGHTYRVELVVEGEMQDGMVLDFADLKAQIRGVLARYDHRHWNDFMDYPTVENICERLATEIAAVRHVPLHRSASTRATPSGRRRTGGPRDDPRRRGAAARRPRARDSRGCGPLSAREDPRAREEPGTPRTARPSSRCAAATRRAAGPTGRRASSSARRSCSSTPPASARSSSSAASAPTRAWRPHVTHVGVHDHGFNNVSTWGALRRLALEGRYEAEGRERASASSRSRRAARCRPGAGRAPPTAAATSTRSTARTRSSPTRCARCARSRSRTAWATRCSRRGTGRCRCSSGSCCTRAPPARFAVYKGRGRDTWDERGPRRAREPLRRDRRQLPLPRRRSRATRRSRPGRAGRPGCCSASPRSSSSSRRVAGRRARAARGPGGGRGRTCSRPRGPPPRTTCETTPTDGIPYWDTGAPGLAAAARPPRPAGRPVQRPRAGRHLGRGDRGAGPAAPRAAASSGAATPRTGRRFFQAGLTITRTLFGAAVPERGPVAPGAAAPLRLPPAERLGLRAPGPQGPCGESSQWGDYHLRELALYVQRLARRRAVLRLLRPRWSAAVRRVALVTGGTRGIGLGDRPRARGARASTSRSAACARRREVARRPRGAARDGRRRCATSRPTSAIARGPRAARRRGARRPSARSTLLVNNAGVAPARPRRPPRGRRGELRRACCGINLQGPYFLTQAVARWMIEQKRADAAARARSSSSPRSRPTVGLAEPGRVLRQQGRARDDGAALRRAARRRRGSRSTRCGPGIIRTDMTAGVAETYDQLIGEGLVPQGRWGEPEDVGRVVAALARGDAAYSTGAVSWSTAASPSRRL